MDWKDKLSQIATDTETHKKEEKKENHSEKVIQEEPLIIRFEKRNGKPASVISNFSGNKTELKNLAKKLKIYCGSGGSAKDDEILIQGDARNKISEFLKSEGYRVKGDFEKRK